jgi:two-component system response regulator AtoC
MENERETNERVSRLERQVARLRGDLARAGGPLEGLVGSNAAMRELFSTLLALRPSDGPVAIAGESGTGRTAVASALHELSGADGGFLEISAGGFLGEFSPVRTARGASPGTLTLDGLTRLSPREQTELSVRLAGCADWILFILPESPRDLRRAGHLSEVLARVPEDRVLKLPPLRERREDIPRLVEFFLEELSSVRRTPRPAVDPRSLEVMHAYEWRGNLRELREAVGRADALADGGAFGPAAIRAVLGAPAAAAADLVPGASADVVPVRVGESLAEVERRLIQRTLEFAMGNKRKAADLLELSLKTVYNKVKEYGLDVEFKRRFRKAPRSG